MGSRPQLPELSPTDLASFADGWCDKVEIEGPFVLYRLAGWGEHSSHFRGANGRYWMAEETFREIERRVAALSPDSVDFQQAWNDLRLALALPKSWNDFSLAFRLVIPAGFKLAAYSGVISGQLEVDKDAERFLPGGAVQYLLDPTPYLLWIEAERGLKLPGRGLTFASITSVEIVGSIPAIDHRVGRTVESSPILRVQPKEA